jgi:Tol biopolymer transport system component
VPEPRLDYLTQDPVEGHLLVELLVGGPLPIEEATRYAIELGTAIGRVHARGQVHGAVSPANIAITGEGLRLLRPAVLGEESVPYSSPEQVRGEQADSRSDVFSFGAVAYEMASGQRPFPGSGVDLRRAIQSDAPAPLNLIAPGSAALEGVIAGCLEKDPARRRQRIQNAVIELKLAGGRSSARTETRGDEIPRRKLLRPSIASKAVEVPQFAAYPISPKTPPVASPRSSVAPYAAQVGKPGYGIALQRRVWVVAAAALALAASGVAAVLYLNKRPSVPVLKFAVTQPEHTSYPGMPAVSPDGRYLTFSAVGPEGKRMLWLRPLDALHATVIGGTEGASAPFWSPDSQQIAFFAARNLTRVKITGGAPEKICDAEASPGGGAWNRDGWILFSPSLADGLYKVPAAGGKPQQVLKLDESKGERGAVWPQFLADGRHYIFYQQTDNAETAGVYVASLDSPDSRRLFASQTNAVYSISSLDTPKTGYLLYINERNLMAVPFHTIKLEVAGEAIVLANDIGAVRSLSLAPISVSAGGVLVYQGVGQPTRQMVWLDRAGRQLVTAGEPGEYGPPRVSPDGNRAVVAKVGKDQRSAHLWLLDRSGAAQQISSGSIHEGSPVWAPDGTRIAYFAAQGAAYDIYVRTAARESKGELLLKSDTNKFPTDWSRDGRFIIFGQQGEGTRLDVFGFGIGDHRAAPVLNTVYAEGFGAVAPNGKWLAYQSDQSGRNEVYIQSFDGLSNGTKRRWQVSRGGGLPRWRSDSNELFYITQDGRLMSVPVHDAAEGGIEAGQPQLLFQTQPVPKTWNLFDVSPDGQRFLFNMPLEWTSANPITVVTNWTEKLRDQ